MLDTTYIKQIYEETYSLVYNYFFYLTFSREKTEDMTSMTYLRMIEKIALYDPKKSNMRVWILTLARNIWIDEMRKETKWKWKKMEEWEMPESDSSEKALRKAEDAATIEKFLTRLTRREQELICMRYFMELSYHEIAEISGLTEKNVSVILSRSLKKMRKGV